MLCNLNQFKEQMKRLRFYRRNSELTPKNGDVVDMVRDEIFKDYKNIIDSFEKDGAVGKNFVPACVKWCVNKGLIQQALTIIESYIPEELITSGIIYYAINDNEADMARNVLEKAVEKLEYYGKNRNDLERYYIKKVIKKNFCEKQKKHGYIVSDVKIKKCFLSKNVDGICLYTKVNLQDGYQDFIIMYKEFIALVDFRNQTNHADFSENAQTVAEKIRRFCHHYEKVNDEAIPSNLVRMK